MKAKSSIYLLLCLHLACAEPHPDELTAQEDIVFPTVQAFLREHNVGVQGFFHMSRMTPKWKEVLSEQLMLISGFHRDQVSMNVAGRLNTSGPTESKTGGLLSILDKLNIFDAMLSGERENIDEHITTEDIINELKPHIGNEKSRRLREVLSITPKPSVHRYTCSKAYVGSKTQSDVDSLAKGGQSCGEYPSLSALHDHCLSEVSSGRQSLVFYAHLKSAGKSYPDVGAYWRDVMNAIVLEYPSTCIRALMHGNSVCGALYKPEPSSHFSGNFWWASCNHIARLPPLRHPLFYWLDPEMFVMNVGPPNVSTDFAARCAYDAIGLDKNRQMYNVPLSYKDYAPQLLQLLKSATLPPCGVVTHTTHGKRLPGRRKGYLNHSQACEPDGLKSNVITRGKPCLSLKTPPNSLNPKINFYGLSYDPHVSWGYSYDIRGQREGPDTSNSRAQYIARMKQLFPLKYGD